MSRCRLCPRRCGAERDRSPGFCGVPAAPLVCRAAPHFGEEPCISGSRGSGAVFFAGCALGCVYCQNREISRGSAGVKLDVPALRDLFRRLADSGVHNLNLVTASHFSDTVAEALAGLRLEIPVVWNSSGYETVEQLRQLEGLVQVWLPDFKYADPMLAARYSAAPDYPQVALAAIQEMYRQAGPADLDGDGLLRRGVLIRHLILPGAAENTLRVIDAVEDHFPAQNILFSLMAQYTPMPGLDRWPELTRPVSREEYERCRSYLDFSEIEKGYVQELESAGTEQIPAFDGTGVQGKN
ncbi:MAG: radical SAM protein [Oscillospiraceae bacterium]|nr:radical SAM protein [Oscillospiraceae bacterium]